MFCACMAACSCDLLVYYIYLSPFKMQISIIYIYLPSKYRSQKLLQSVLVVRVAAGRGLRHTHHGLSCRSLQCL